MKIPVTQKVPKAPAFPKLFWEKATFTALLLLTVVFAQAQNITVRGRVLNESGQGVPNASITVKGSTTGVTSNNEGNYEISAPSNGTLVISSVGFTPQEIAIGGRTTINTALQASAGTDLEQVVVIGYGTARKRDVSGSTVTVKGETLNEIKAPNIYNQLQGRAAGVDIVNNSSQIGAGGQIRIRGNRSISGNNDPLIVVPKLEQVAKYGYVVTAQFPVIMTH
jgi:TonB-dependent starch-binding outer membrane protein SusC